MSGKNFATINPLDVTTHSEYLPMKKKEELNTSAPVTLSNDLMIISQVERELQENPQLLALMREAMDCDPKILRLVTKKLKEIKS